MHMQFSSAIGLQVEKSKGWLHLFTRGNNIRLRPLQTIHSRSEFMSLTLYTHVYVDTRHGSFKLENHGEFTAKIIRTNLLTVRDKVAQHVWATRDVSLWDPLHYFRPQPGFLTSTQKGVTTKYQLLTRIKTKPNLQANAWQCFPLMWLPGLLLVLLVWMSSRIKAIF